MLMLLRSERDFNNYKKISAAHALGKLGPRMPPEAATGLLAMIRFNDMLSPTSSVAAAALAQMGEKIPSEIQQALLSMLREDQPSLRGIASLVLDAVGITEVSLP